MNVPIFYQALTIPYFFSSSFYISKFVVDAIRYYFLLLASPAVILHVLYLVFTFFCAFFIISSIKFTKSIALEATPCLNPSTVIKVSYLMLLHGTYYRVDIMFVHV